MNFRKLLHYILAFCFSVLWMMVAGQRSAPYVEAKPGADSIYIGSQTTIVFSLASPVDYLWQWPEMTDKLSDKVEIVSQTGIDTTRQRGNDLVLFRKQLLITSFDSGYHAIPAFAFQYRAPGDTAWILLETEAFLLYVAGLEVDLSAPIRDIKGPMRVPVTFMEILPWLLLAIIVVGGILYYRYYMKKLRERASLLPKPAKPKIPAHRKAMDALEQLRQKKLWQSGRVKEYHSEITDIVRHYLEERFSIMAVEMTTAEIMDAAVAQLIPLQAREKLLAIFERADLVKFAKSQPLPGEHEESFVLAVDLVRSTIPVASESTLQPEDIKQSGSNNLDATK